jgi:hypothetical protein
MGIGMGTGTGMGMYIMLPLPAGAPWGPAVMCPAAGMSRASKSNTGMSEASYLGIRYNE